MRRFIPIASVLLLPLLSAVVMAQTGGGMSGDEGNGSGHGYGMMGGYYPAVWIVCALAKVVVVVIGLWLLLRITRAVERIAGSK